MATKGGVSYDRVLDMDLMEISLISESIEKINKRIEREGSK